jgi:short-subunit dehydrogenase
MTENLAGKWALVTGASSGFGVDFAKQLAAKGVNLVLVARREDRLRAVADEVAQTHRVQTVPVILDLAHDGVPQQLFDRTKSAGQDITVLINNAGFGLYGRFTEIEWAREREMLDIDITALVHLTKLYAADMAARKQGYILQVASNGAFQPTPLYAVYSAAKAFVLSFGEAVNYELRGSGVSVTTTCPGPAATEFLAVSGQRRTFYQRLVMMESADVVRISLDAMLRRKASVVPGRINALAAWGVRFVPRRLAAALAERTMKSD